MVALSNVARNSPACSTSLRVPMVLRVKANSARSASTDKRGTTRLLQGLQFLAGFEADGLAGRDRHFGASSRVTANAGLTRAHIEDTKAAKLDTLPLRQRSFHAFEHGLHGHLGLRFSNAGLVDNFVDDIQLDQSAPRPLRGKLSPLSYGKATP